MRGHDDENSGFALHLHIVYLLEEDPDDYLANPILAPLATLAKGRKPQRERSFGAALQLIRDCGLASAGELFQTAETLAQIRLDTPTIDRIRKENGMSIQPIVDHYRDTEVGHALRYEGREEGRREEKQSLLRELLLANFGETADLTAAVHRLSTWSDRDALRAVLTAPDLETLLTCNPPT